MKFHPYEIELMERTMTTLFRIIEDINNMPIGKECKARLLHEPVNEFNKLYDDARNNGYLINYRLDGRIQLEDPDEIEEIECTRRATRTVLYG